MKELELKYGCNPNQKPSKIFVKDGRDLPITVLNGRPGYIVGYKKLDKKDCTNIYKLML